MWISCNSRAAQASISLQKYETISSGVFHACWHFGQAIASCTSACGSASARRCAIAVHTCAGNSAAAISSSPHRAAITQRSSNCSRFVSRSALGSSLARSTLVRRRRSTPYSPCIKWSDGFSSAFEAASMSATSRLNSSCSAHSGQFVILASSGPKACSRNANRCASRRPMLSCASSSTGVSRQASARRVSARCAGDWARPCSHTSKNSAADNARMADGYAGSVKVGSAGSFTS